MNFSTQQPPGWHGFPTRANGAASPNPSVPAQPRTLALLSPSSAARTFTPPGWRGGKTLRLRGRPHGFQKRATSCGRPGFSFTEILFAVLILGIGFILVAAIFPVAIRQTQASSEETVASTIAKESVSYLAKYDSQAYWAPPVGASTQPSAPDGQVHPIGPIINPTDTPTTNTTLWPLISGNLILSSDPRYAWVPMYRQDPTAANKYVQIIMIGVQVRNQTTYSASADLTLHGTYQPTLVARPLQATFTNHTPGQTNTVVLGDLSNNNFLSCAAEGAYIVVANDSSTANPNANGFVYRLGNPTANPNEWELAPGNDMAGSAIQPAAAQVLIVGRGYDNGTATAYSGPVQDVAVYTTFITVH